MIKDANTQKAWLSASATFWMSLLVSSVMVYGLALQARADEVPGKEAIAKIPPSPASVETPVEVSTVSQGRIQQLEEKGDKEDSGLNVIDQRGNHLAPLSQELQSLPHAFNV